ncbi:ADP-ribosyl cyclase/cyclic ADP-ribose hydrolase 1 [Perognathus longimembris pacificus]|uniref:ADP-ribosyl cyclase/cyclic ADP-ribose hydrolase 1 n=1 Tax=Perognathus longimembris pacificus TaxID=214514 RepID=UPI0020189D97|nr:ADP-ribosyl cyclase/cyclic ADP-ribose hydrolase 1 [Perognathus longimembris pacificus]
MDSCECCGRPRKCLICLGVGLLVVAVSVVTVVGVLKWRQSKPLAWNGTRTTPHFSEIFLGRCYTYTQVLRPGLGNPDCVSIMNAFKSAFISKNPCNITEEDYRPLIELDKQAIPCNKSLFWSKSNDLAHQYTQIQREMFTLEDTLLGYMANDLSWCGDPNTSEMNEHSCPNWRLNCPNNPVSVFWKVLSRKFAENACGVAQVMLNGSLLTPFDKSSTFGSVEVLHLNPQKVHTLQAWVMNDLGILPSASCSKTSINELKMIVNQKHISFECHPNYRPARLIQCVKTPEHCR